MMIKQIQHHITRALNGLRWGFRGKMTRLNSAPRVQLAQVAGLADELLQNLELMQHYGFTSCPLPDTECIVLPLGGRTGHSVIIATEHGNFRLKNLKAGEVALYSDEGDHFIFKRGRVTEIVTQTLNITASTVINLTTPTLNLSGDLNVGGQIVAQQNITDSAASAPKSMAGMRAVYDSHTHSDPQGGSVGAPNTPM